MANKNYTVRMQIDSPDKWVDDVDVNVSAVSQREARYEAENILTDRIADEYPEIANQDYELSVLSVTEQKGLGGFISGVVVGVGGTLFLQHRVRQKKAGKIEHVIPRRKKKTAAKKTTAKKSTPKKTVKPPPIPKKDKSDWKEEMRGDIEAYGVYETFLDQRSPANWAKKYNIKDPKFLTLANAYVKAAKDLENYVNKTLKGDAQYYVQSTIDNEGFDYAFEGYSSYKTYSVWDESGKSTQKPFRNQTFHTKRKKYLSTRKALLDLLGVKDYKKGGSVGHDDVFIVVQPNHTVTNGKFVFKSSNSDGEIVAEDMNGKTLTLTGIEPNGIMLYSEYVSKNLSSYVPMGDEPAPVDFSHHKALDNININGKDAVVLSNDVENKKMVVEYMDDTMETIDYGKSVQLTKTTKTNHPPQPAPSHFTDSAHYVGKKGELTPLSDEEKREIAIQEHWDMMKRQYDGWAVVFLASGLEALFNSKADAEDYVKKYDLVDKSDEVELYSDGGTIDSYDYRKEENSKYYDELIPDRGKSGTVEGEMLRAINKIMHRFLNSGDRWDVELKHAPSGSTVAPYYYLTRSKEIPAELRKEINDSFEASRGRWGMPYYRNMNLILKDILDHIKSKDGKYTKTNEDMLDYKHSKIHSFEKGGKTKGESKKGWFTGELSFLNW